MVEKRRDVQPDVAEYDIKIRLLSMQVNISIFLK